MLDEDSFDMVNDNAKTAYRNYRGYNSSKNRSRNGKRKGKGNNGNRVRKKKKLNSSMNKYLKKLDD